MKVEVTKKFHDINSFSIIHNVGDVMSVDEERGSKLIKLGLCNPVEEKTTAENPVEEKPHVETPIEEKPHVETPIEETPVEEKPIVVAPIEEKKEETPKTPKEAKTEKK